MIAKSLETLMSEAAKLSESDLLLRFQKLRDFGLLPKSRGKNAQDLTSPEIVSGILSVVSARPGFAGLTVKILRDLRPVGGPTASFQEAKSLAEALESIIDEDGLAESLLEVRISDSEIYTNSSGRAIIKYRDGKDIKTAYYTRKEALTLMVRGAEKTYNPRDVNSDIIVEKIFFPRLFKMIARRVKEDHLYKKLREGLLATG